MFIVYMNDKKEIIYIPICQESSLPKNGWIHECYVCCSRTGRFWPYRKDECEETITLYQIMLCPICQHHYNKYPKKIKALYQHIEYELGIEPNINSQ